MTISIVSSEENLRLAGTFKRFSRAAMGVEVVLGDAEIRTTDDWILAIDPEQRVLLDVDTRVQLEGQRYNVGSPVEFKLKRQEENQYKVDGLVIKLYR